MANNVWTDEQVEEARLHWFYESGQSFTQTSNDLGIPERTLYFWAKRDSWREKRRSELKELAGPAVEEFQVDVKLALSTGIQSLVQRMQSTRNDDWYLRALAFLYTVAREPDIQHQGLDGKAMSLSEAKILSVDEVRPDRDKLLALASSSLEENFRDGKISKGRRKT